MRDGRWGRGNDGRISDAPFVSPFYAPHSASLHVGFSTIYASPKRIYFFIMCPAGTHRRPFAVSGLKPGVSHKSVLSGDDIPSTYSPASRTIYSEGFFLARIERAAGNGSLGYCGPVVSLKLNPQAIVSRPARRGYHGWSSVGWLICPLRGLYLGVPSSTPIISRTARRGSWGGLDKSLLRSSGSGGGVRIFLRAGTFAGAGAL